MPVTIRLPSTRRPAVPARAVLAALLVGVAGCGPRPDSEPAPTGSPAPALLPVPASEPLAPGAALLPLAAAGWLNGPPPQPGGPGVRLLLVDLWAHWCPFCRGGVPELVRLHREFAPRGVAFVSLTNMGQESVAGFVGQFAVPWPNGYGAEPEAIRALGAGTGNPMPAYGVAPTVYLVGPDGRVRWTDRRGRYRHTETAAWGRELQAAIEAGLAGPADARPGPGPADR